MIRQLRKVKGVIYMYVRFVHFVWPNRRCDRDPTGPHGQCFITLGWMVALLSNMKEGTAFVTTL